MAVDICSVMVKMVSLVDKAATPGHTNLYTRYSGALWGKFGIQSIDKRPKPWKSMWQLAHVHPSMSCIRLVHIPPFHMRIVKRFPTRIRNRFACSDSDHVHTGDFAFVVMTSVTSFINKAKMAVSVTTVWMFVYFGLVWLKLRQNRRSTLLQLVHDLLCLFFKALIFARYCCIVQ